LETERLYIISKSPLEGFINNFIVEKVDEKLLLQAEMYRSQCKRDKPHIVAITVWCYLDESFSTTLLTFVISVIYRYVNEAK